MTEQEHPLEYLPELALGVLAEDDAPGIRAHLATCDSCAAEFEVMAGAARLLPFAVQDAEPSPGTRDSLMQRIATEPRVLTRRTIVRPAWQRFSAIAAGVALLLLVGAAAGESLFGGSDSGSSRETKNQRTLVEAVAKGTASRETAEQGGAKAMLVYAPGTNAAFAWLEGLPSLPNGKEYQAWFIGDGNPQPANTFANSGGVWLDSPAQVDSFAAFALTIEDEGGAKAPTQQPFVVVNLKSAAKVPVTWEEWIQMTRMQPTD
ncbi:MAG: anti-sigma factor [bacterium]